MPGVLRKTCRPGIGSKLWVAVLTALGEQDALVRDAEQRAGQALRTMTDDEGLSLREAVEWCGSGVTRRDNLVAAARRRSSGAVKTDASDDGRLGQLGARRSATVRWSSVEADARALG